MMPGCASIGARIRTSDCPSKGTARLGDVLACQPIYVEQDIWDARGLPAFTTSLEEGGAQVLRRRPTSGQYLSLRVRSVGTGYGNNYRVRIEVRDEADRLRYFSEEIASGWRYWRDIRAQQARLCVVSPVRCP
jgi:hypothetical protein